MAQLIVKHLDRARNSATFILTQFQVRQSSLAQVVATFTREEHLIVRLNWRVKVGATLIREKHLIVR